MKKLLFLCLIVFCLAGCSSVSDNGLVNYMEAKEKIINENAVLIDVRTESEYEEGHIEGSINIPLDQIENISYDKDEIIIVYCRSGGRSKTAAETLIANGYMNVYDFGAIGNWIVK